MNTLEHNKVEREEKKGLFFGVVIKVDDPEGLKRVKVRVHGVYEEPIKKEHIPWALPILDFDVPILGDEVAVIFESDGDIERPRYFPRTILSSIRLTDYNAIYAAIVQTKKGSIKTDVSVVDETFSEPETESIGVIGQDNDTKIYPKDVATEDGEGIDTGDPNTGSMTEVVKSQDLESMSVYHPSGTFIEVHSDGSLVIHGVKDIFAVSDGDLNSVFDGKGLMKFNGKVELRVGGGISIKTDGAVKVDSPNVEITGGQLKVDGTVAPTGSGPFCAVPNCFFNGAPHVGNIVSGT